MPGSGKGAGTITDTLLWKGQKLAVTVLPEMVEIQNQTGSDSVAVEVWGKDYSFEKELILTRKR